MKFICSRCGKPWRLFAAAARAVLMCVYRNRAYEDTLLELADTAEKAGFHVIAAVAAIAEHSVIREIAAGRPDAADRARLISSRSTPGERNASCLSESYK